jgi:hypothetical protein
MRRILRDMRSLSGELSMSGDRDKAERLLTLGVQLINATQAEQVVAIRSELLSWTIEPALQDDLSVVLTQLRAAQANLGE